MNLSNITNRCLNLAVIAILSLPLPIKAEIDKKFYNKAAETVWGMDLPQFNPTADLSDSLYRDQSANFIARYIGLDAKYDNTVNPSKQTTIGIGNSNTTVATLIRRNMVRLNDAAAIDAFSDFTIQPPIKNDYRGYMIRQIKPAFGARVIKPDGRIIDVDMSEAVTVTTGKKNKDDEYKVAIPGLAPGDVLDYFFLSDYYFEECSMPDFTVNFLAQYPTRNLMIDCRVDPELALEYGSYNGAPRLNTFDRIGKQNRLFIEMADIEPLDEALPYFSVARQMPFMHIYVINHSSRLEFHPKVQRAGGMRIASTPFVMRDVASAIISDKAPDKLVNETYSILKDWKKTHPEATETEAADHAWLALRYVLYKNDIKVSQRQFVLALYKVMEKHDNMSTARIGVTTSRSEVPITEIAHYSDAEYFLKVGDRFYFSLNRLTLLPGETPNGYDTENYVLYTARPNNDALHTSAEYGKFPKTKSAWNTKNVQTSISLDVDNPNTILVNSDMTATGASKSFAEDLILSRRQIEDLEMYLGQKPSKKKPDSDEVEEAENCKDSARELAKLIWGTKDDAMTSHEIISSGSTPDQAEVKINLKGKIEGAVTDAGNNLIVNIGRFCGEQKQFKGNQRKRDISVVRSSPSKTDITVRFEIPEGYELADGTLDDLNRSVICRDGAFNTMAEIDGRTVVLRVIERYNSSISPVSSWPDLLKIQDTAHEFMSASIVLRPA